MSPFLVVVKSDAALLRCFYQGSSRDLDNLELLVLFTNRTDTCARYKDNLVSPLDEGPLIRLMDHLLQQS